MTFLDIAARNERDHAEALALREMQIRVLCAYRDELEDKGDIAAEMIADYGLYTKDEVGKLVDDAYEVRQAARRVAVGA